MTLNLEQDAPEGEKLSVDNPSQISIISLVRDLNWSLFTFLTLKKDSLNWIEISGNLAEDGLAIVLEQDGVQEVSEYPPESTTEVENVLIDYLNGRDESIVKYFEPQPILSQNYYNWKAQQESNPKRRVITKLLSIIAAFMIMGTVAYGLYLWTTHEFKFIGHSTSTTVATVVETKYRPYMRSMVQIAKYEFQLNDSTYFGYFRASNARTRKHFIGDRVKVKYAIDEPSISMRVATYKK